ncbi:MAG: PAS domain S-box protein [Patescibacteria group bacterium]
MATIEDTTSPDFFRQLVDSLEGYAILTLDTKGIISSWNTGAQNIFGYLEDEIIGKHVTTLFTSDYIKSKKFETKLMSADKMGMAEDEKWYVTKNNQTFWGKGRIFPFRDKKGNIKGYTKILRDLTSLPIDTKNRIEGNLKFLSEASKFLASSLDYQTTLNGVASLAVPQIADWCSIDMIDKNGHLQLVAIAHKDPKKVRWGRQLRKDNPTDMDAKSGLPNVLRTGKSEFYANVSDEMLVASAKNEKELKLLRKIGLTSVMIVPICMENECIGAISFISTETKRNYTPADLSMAEELASRASMAIENAQLYDSAQKEIAYRKKIEEDLRRSEVKFKAIYEANIIGISYNVDNKIIEANDAFLQMTGYTRTDVKSGKVHWDEITPIEFKEADNKAIVQLMKTGVAKPWEKEYIKKDGSQVPIIIGVAMLNKDTFETISIILDITERKKLEQRKDEFIGIASHELKTPLTSIKGYVQILERIIEEMGDDKLKLYLKKTHTYIERLNSLIADLLDVSKIQAGKLQMNSSEFEFDMLVQDSIESIQHINIRHKIIKDGSVNQKITGDRHRLEQVFTNLLSNAIKYSPHADEVVVHVSKDDNCVKVGIQDFGVGIPKSKQSKLFDRFYRVEETAKKFSGLGIGLYISHEIVLRHKGTMWVESDEDKGSTFYFTLPIDNK